MTPGLAAFLGVVAGVVIGVALTLVVRSNRREPEPPDPLGDLKAIVDALPAGAALVGPGDDILAANTRVLDSGVIRGGRVAVPAILDLVRETRLSGEEAAVDVVNVRAGRAERQLAVRVLRLEDHTVFLLAEDRGTALRVQASARDFLANATHELKTPVGAITLLAEASEQAAEYPEAVVRFSRKIQSEAVRLTQLVTQVVQLSRLQGDVAPIVDTVSVDEVVGLSLDRSRQLAEQRSISLTRGGTSGLFVRGNRDQLVTAVTNLVHNAITYSDPKARVVVSTRRVNDADDERVAVAVSDNGIGISPEDQQRVFERFYRVDYARSRATGGTGLGLSIVSEIMEGHGGDVSVWSRPGSGSTFTLTLPAAPEWEEDGA